jgi:hypothetical protein
MGLGWHVALERPIPETANMPVDGKALIHHQHELDELARQLGLDLLTDFVSVDPAKVKGYLKEQGLDPELFPIPEEEWFDPVVGLATIRGLSQHIRVNPGSVPNSHRIVRDLQGIEAILALAEGQQVRFHLISELPDGPPEAH